MKHLSGKGIAAAEYLFVGVYLAVYAFLLLVSDPEWLMWAGPVTLGAFPITAPAASFPFEPLEVLQAASYLALPGLLALAFLSGLRGKARRSREAELRGLLVEEKHEGAQGVREHRKAA